MTSNDGSGNELENRFAQLSLEEENDGLVMNEVDVPTVQNKYNWCLVGRSFTKKNIDFVSMKNQLASLWHPVRVLMVDHGLSTNIVWQRLGPNVQPHQCQLHFMDIWMHVLELPLGFMSERVATLIENYVGRYVASNENNFNGLWRSYMRIRVSVDVRLPLKKKMKLKKQSGEWFWTRRGVRNSGEKWLRNDPLSEEAETGRREEDTMIVDHAGNQLPIKEGGSVSGKIGKQGKEVLNSAVLLMLLRKIRIWVV
ncbi:conserved hypothetical protein [Ricinus communis]|uniref:Uncharacterized protein n=1 Tax=Ricinus communis TaxID=3988 RepID=B9RX86_RICCO|nr:conserved hypothetical protein [Ricinus communis]